jgi:hypothetical protein
MCRDAPSPSPSSPPTGLRPRLDLLLFGVVVVGALLLRVWLMRQHAPAPLHALGPDFDDWEGVFQGALHSWPPAWDDEWNRRYPLLPVLAVAFARGTGVPVAMAAQWINLLGGALLVGCTYALGLRTVGRPAALLAACWVALQDGLCTFQLTSSAYGLVPVIYGALLLGFVLAGRDRWIGRGLVLASSALLSLLVLQGLVHVAVTTGVALLAFAPGAWRAGRALRRLLGLLLPALLGAGLAVLTMGRFAQGGESPLRGALRLIWINVHLTLLHSDSYGPPTGHKVHRLLSGVPRHEHFLATVREQLELPAVVLAVLLALGLLVILRRRARLGACALLLLLIGGSLYGLVANAEDFHSAQWLPALALVVSVGLLGWVDWLPWARARVPLRLLLGAGLLGTIVLRPLPPPPGSFPRYGRLPMHADMSAEWAEVAAASRGPVSASGTLLIDDADAWAHRGFLLGRAPLAWIGHMGDGRPAVEALDRPLLLLTARSPRGLDGRLPGAWRYRPLQHFELAPRPLWLVAALPNEASGALPVSEHPLEGLEDHR